MLAICQIGGGLA